MFKEMRKQIFRILFLIVFMIIVSLIGCGSGDAGGGRQILPGEKVITVTPFQPLDPDPGSEPDDIVESGWRAMDYGNYAEAIVFFTDVIENPDSTGSQRQIAYNGRGWAKAREYGAVQGISDFVQGGNLEESLLGYALALVQEAKQSSVVKAVDVFEQIGLSDPSYRLKIANTAIGVSSSEAHAMLAYAYFWRSQPGDHGRARTQINAAMTTHASNSPIVTQIYNTLKEAGLSGI